MTILGFMLAAGLVQLTVFVSYPDTGPFGMAFLVVSLIVWCSFFITIVSALPGIKASTRLFFNTAGVLLSLLSAAFFMPQRDGVSVLDKFSLGKYPTRAAVYTGLKRLGIDYPALKPREKPVEPVVL